MDYKILGSRIREERIRLSLTQETLAEDINISVSYMGQIERGERSLSLDTLVKLTKRLGVTIDYLLQESVNTDDNKILTAQITNLLNNRSPKEIHMAIDLIKVLFTHLNSN